MKVKLIIEVNMDEVIKEDSFEHWKEALEADFDVANVKDWNDVAQFIAVNYFSGGDYSMFVTDESVEVQ